MENKILEGDALQELKKLPSESINCVMTSPPYWALRDYQVRGQLGLEPTFDEYIKHLCDIFDEVQRVLRKDGTCFVNLGDTYSTVSGNMRSKEFNHPKYQKAKKVMNFTQPKTELLDKTLIMIPFRFAIEMVNRGWILRNTIIWHKANCMPSSAKDRFTVDFEYLFFFTKSKKYWFETQREPTITRDKLVRDRDTTKLNNTPGRTRMAGLRTNDYETKNKRTVWNINPKPFPEAHFAVYPEELCVTPLKAGCPEFVCVKCGKAREKIYDVETSFESGSGKSGKTPIGKNRDNPQSNSGSYDVRMGAIITQKFKGYTDCGCKAEFTGGTVLDPFFGAGTTGLVALKQNKKFLGIELNPEYIKIAEERLRPLLEQTKLFK